VVLTRRAGVDGVVLVAMLGAILQRIAQDEGIPDVPRLGAVVHARDVKAGQLIPTRTATGAGE
jgi:hypothetical protein